MVGICKKKVIYKKKSLMFRFFSNFSHNGRLRILVRISTSDAAPDKSCTKFVLQIITEEVVVDASFDPTESWRNFGENVSLDYYLSEM